MAPLQSESITHSHGSSSSTRSELSELDSNQFDDPDTDEDYDASSSNQSSGSLPPSSKKRKIRATNTWSYAREPREGEPVKNKNGRRYWYCAECIFWREVITTNIRTHLHKKHGITVKEEDLVIKKVTKQRLEGLYQKQGEAQVQKVKEEKERILRESINQPVVREALAQLIVVRNLPYEAVTWPELRALLLAVNYTCDEVLVDSSATVLKLIEESFLLDKAILKQKLHTSLTPIHLSLDAWSSPNRKTFIAICAHFVDSTGVLRKALLALPFLPGRHGGDKQVEVLW